MYHKTTKQGEKVINSEPNVGKIDVKEAIVDKIGTEQEEKEISDVYESEGDKPRDDENNDIPDISAWSGRVSIKPRRLEPLGMGLNHAEKTYFACMMRTDEMEM